ncbi:hypothetical protein NQZ68_011010 [Dissostichus eleginoides]|nr:hypothetical protein NQZ68_011010 [Dissostichus eleginoides]
MACGMMLAQCESIAVRDLLVGLNCKSPATESGSEPKIEQGILPLVFKGVGNTSSHVSPSPPDPLPPPHTLLSMPTQVPPQRVRPPVETGLVWLPTMEMMD